MVARRRNMVSVDVHPGDSAEERVFAARCSPIFELYSLQLKAGDPIKATASWMRITVTAEEYPGYRDIPPQPRDNFGFSEFMHCGLDSGILDAPRNEWPRRYLDWLHEQMMAMAAERSWDPAPLVAARLGCLDAGLVLYLESKPKSSPDRRHKAVLTFQIDEDGDRHLRLVIRDREGSDVAVAEHVHQAFYPDVREFRSLATGLKWRSSVCAGIGDAPTGKVPEWVALAKAAMAEAAGMPGVPEGVEVPEVAGLPDDDENLFAFWEDVDRQQDNDLSVSLPGHGPALTNS